MDTSREKKREDNEGLAVLHNAVTASRRCRVAHLGLQRSSGRLDQQTLDLSYGLFDLHNVQIISIVLGLQRNDGALTRHSSFDSMSRCSFGGPSGGGSFPGS